VIISPHFIYLNNMTIIHKEQQNGGDIIGLISKLEKKIQRSPGCSYLYWYFDELIGALERRKSDGFSNEEIALLQGLIQDYAYDSTYNTYGSANWVRYSVRCFYCADRLTEYLPDVRKKSMEEFLSEYFVTLTDKRVASAIDSDVLSKYVDKLAMSTNPMELYDQLLSGTVRESYMCRLWSADEVTLALRFTRAIDWLVRRYVDRYSDYSMLKSWIPALDTVRLADIWYRYPDSPNYEHAGRHTAETVEKSLDEMLEIHLSLFGFWYEYKPQEVIDTLPLETLIEILEVSEDEEFDKTLHQMVTLPHNEKVMGILEHFTHDDEVWIVNLAESLLSQYGH